MILRWPAQVWPSIPPVAAPYRRETKVSVTMPDILGEWENGRKGVTRVAEPSRESQLPRRFYKGAAARFHDGVWQIELDGKPVRTPGRNLLALESQVSAERLAQEWDDQRENIDPMTMPLTRLVNTALDGVAADPQAVKEDIVRYAGSDLVCYRAGSPQGLVDRQNELWDPLVEWAQAALGSRLVLAEGVIHVGQPAESIAAFSTHVGLIDNPITLAATHVATSLTGSAITAMALLKHHLTLDQAWAVAHVDEDWNISQWGEDDEAAATRALRLRDMTAAVRLMDGRV